MSYVELTVGGDFRHAIEAIADTGVNLTAFLVGDNGNKIVVDDADMDKILKLDLDIVCITPVNVVSIQNRPGGLDALLSSYRNFEIVSSYVGGNNVAIIKMANSCLYYPNKG